MLVEDFIYYAPSPHAFRANTKDMRNSCSNVGAQRHPWYLVSTLHTRTSKHKWTLHLVKRHTAVALTNSAVIRCEHDKRVVEHPCLAIGGDDKPDLSTPLSRKIRDKLSLIFTRANKIKGK